MTGNLRELSERYLEKTLENPKAAGTAYTLIDPQGTRYPVVGTVGDISLLIDPITGESVEGRTLITTCRIKRLPIIPQRGWQAELPDLAGNVQNLFIEGISPDYTIGLYYFTMGLDLPGEPAA